MLIKMRNKSRNVFCYIAIVVKIGQQLILAPLKQVAGWLCVGWIHWAGKIFI